MTGRRPTAVVAYSGHPGAYGEQAAARFLPHQPTRAVAGFAAVVAAVRDGTAAWGVLPCENRYAGAVADAIRAVLAGGLTIVADLWLPVPHALLAQPGVLLPSLTEATSHPQALTQCDAFLVRHRLTPIPALTTATAARAVAHAGPPHRAAIAPPDTAALYGLDIVADHIATDPDNATRFWLVGRAGGTPWAGSPRTVTVAVRADPFDAGGAPPGHVVLGDDGGGPWVVDLPPDSETTLAVLARLGRGPVQPLGCYPRLGGP
jgi:prephenate dehydratase